MAKPNCGKNGSCAAALRRHRFEAETVKDAEAAFALMKAVVEAENPQLVSFGDSMTMRGTGIVRVAAEQRAADAARRVRRLEALRGAAGNPPPRAVVGPFHHGRERRDGAGNTALAGQGGQPHRTGGIRPPEGDHRGRTQQDRGRPRRGRGAASAGSPPAERSATPRIRTPAPKRASARTATRRTASATPGWKCCDAGPTNGCW